MVNRITATCVIENGTVYRNEKPVFHSDAVGVRELLSSIYQYTQSGYSKFHKMDLLSKLGWLAAEVLLSEQAISPVIRPADVGVVLSNANASLDTDIRYFDTVQSMASPALFVYTLPNIMIGEICIRNHFTGENAFFISERFDIAFIHDYVSSLMASGALEVCICGWVELVGEHYQAALFLVEKGTRAMNQEGGTVFETGTAAYPRSFTVDNIDKIYYLNNG